MKTFKTNFISFFLIVLVLGLSSCIKDNNFDQPPVIVPHVNFAATTTIAQLRAMHTIGALDTIKSDTVIIKGIVVANDASGNLYKKMMIEDATAGLELELDRASLYTSFKVGQTVYVKCKGLMMGEYKGQFELGYVSAGAIGRIPDPIIDLHLFLDGRPEACPATDTITLAAVPTNANSRLVCFKNVHFLEAGQVFADVTATSGTSRTVVDDAGNQITLYTSNYASFAANLMPTGKGNIVGVLGQYNTTLQFYIRDMNDLNWVVDNSQKLIEEKFVTGLGAFTSFSVQGTEVWGQYTTPGAVTCAKISGYVSATQSDTNQDWLISPPLDFSQYSSTKFNFQSAMKFGTTGDGSLKTYYSTNYSGTGDPTVATWTEITGAALPAGADWNFVGSGDLDLSFVHATNVYVAFKYTCGSVNVPTWEIADVIVKGVHLKK